ncbi:hypothetical protein NBRC110019_22580 [Neptunitalea chrysea]|uniref:Hemolysin III n=1 Tax=Neptunitalea chrysea TaxID=1647581 RepID=A0A9W6B8Y1_9FLAO|nr:hypothetical protein [Neptunitalea chrysea]GLB53218.1 hypothetical protein NBRC110019_22580 [Neptunitalea chrysea]
MKLPHDSGPIYKETLMTRFPVEPFNTLSNLLFLAILIYFGIKVYRNPKKHMFITCTLPVIFIGYVGGTIYHATRSAEIWLYMDWVPIMLSCLAATIYFIFKSTSSVWQRILWIGLTLVINIGERLLPIPKKYVISIGYILTAIGVLLPIFVYLYKTHWVQTKWIIFSILSFALAISFRILDKHLDFLTMGTHWLWHTFGAIAVFFLITYIYKDDITKPAKN